MFLRKITTALDRFSKFPVVAVLGPRQSGKSTLVKNHFSKYTYVTFDNLNDRAFAEEDPERFLETYENEHGLIIDEFQYVPNILSYIKIAVDTKKRPGYFVITGSQNFLMNEKIAESLAGRVGLLTLLPFSFAELAENNVLDNDLDTLLIQGCYPRIYDEKLLPTDFYAGYLQTYIERDVRSLVNIGNLSTFQRFITLCAGRTGQLLNLAALANDVGVSTATIRKWLSILEASYVIYLLHPYENNFNKRLTKSPKLYFLDTGLACFLLRITSSDILAPSPFRGALFETLIISDLYKQYCNKGILPSFFFWRERGGLHEIDCIVQEALLLCPIEIKSATTFTPHFFDAITYWHSIEKNASQGFVVYGGSKDQERKQGSIISWQSSGYLLDTIKNEALKNLGTHSLKK